MAGTTVTLELEVQQTDGSWPLAQREYQSIERTGGSAESEGLCGLVCQPLFCLPG